MTDSAWIAFACLVAWNLWQRHAIRNLWEEIDFLRLGCRSQWDAITRERDRIDESLNRKPIVIPRTVSDRNRPHWN